MTRLRADATADCERCGMLLTPQAEIAGSLVLECANRHRQTVKLPHAPKVRERARSWIAKRGAQLHVQHERWEREEGDER